jgi:hypothetical protein
MDGELPAGDREAVAAHLRGCAPCARHLEELRAVDAAARELPLDVPDGYFETFRGSLRNRLTAAPPAPRRRVPVWALAAAAAVVLAVLTPRLMRETREPADAVARSVPAPTLPAPPPAAEMQRDTRAADATAEIPPAQPASPARPADSRLEKGAAEPPRTRHAATAAPPAVTAPEPAQNAAAAPAGRPGTAERQAKKDADALRTLGYATGPAEDRVVDAPQAAKEEMQETSAGGRAGEAKARRKAVGALEATGGEGRFQTLSRRTVSSAAEARSLRDAWRALADEATGARADESRVRAIEAGLEAWRMGREERDRAQAREDARAYLDRPDALQPDRVRAVLKALLP